MVLTVVLALKKKRPWWKRSLAPPPDIVSQINLMCRAAVDDCKRTEVRFGIDLSRTREGHEDARAYLVQLVESL